MGYGTRPHDCKTDELESMKTLSLSHCLRGYFSLLYVTKLIVAGLGHAAPHDSTFLLGTHSLDIVTIVTC